MKLRELIEILDECVELFVYDLDECVELVVYDSDGLRTTHLYDKDYFYQQYEEFLKRKGNSH